MLMSQEIQQMANDLISQYGDDAKAIAMLRAAEYAAIGVHYQSGYR